VKVIKFYTEILKNSEIYIQILKNYTKYSEKNVHQGMYKFDFVLLLGANADVF